MTLKGDDKNEFHENIFNVSYIDFCLGIECLTREKFLFSIFSPCNYYFD